LSRRDHAALLRRLAWFAGLWTASVLAIVAIGYLLRLALGV